MDRRLSPLETNGTDSFISGANTEQPHGDPLATVASSDSSIRSQPELLRHPLDVWSVLTPQAKRQEMTTIRTLPEASECDPLDDRPSGMRQVHVRHSKPRPAVHLVRGG